MNEETASETGSVIERDVDSSRHGTLHLTKSCRVKHSPLHLSLSFPSLSSFPLYPFLSFVLHYQFLLSFRCRQRILNDNIENKD